MAIVCGTDLSIHSSPAVRAAAALAFRLGDKELWLVHVLDPALTERLDAAALAHVKAQIMERLGDQARELCAEVDPAHIQTVVLTGGAAEALTSFANAKQASVLVVSSQGHGASPLYRLGGTSERIAIASLVPVIVVRDSAPFVAWSRNERPLRILVGLDFTASSDAAVRLAKQLRQAGSCDLLFAHVHYWYEGTARYGVSAISSGSLTEADQKTEALLVRDLTARVGALPGNGKVTFMPRAGLGRLGDHLLELADAEKADLIVVGTHQRSGARRLASVSSVVLHFGHASVACVPPSGSVQAEARPIRRVLIPTDLSAFGSHAMAQGYSLLQEHGGEVHLVHIVTPDAARSDEPGHDAELVQRLRALVPVWAFERGIVTRTEVVHRSDVARGIREAAARTAADVVCLSSHGRTGIMRAVLGSVAEQVMRESTVPVMVVRPPAP